MSRLLTSIASASCAFVGLLSCLPMSGCTAANPAFSPADAAVTRDSTRDGPQRVDGGGEGVRPSDSIIPPPDQRILPDVVPPVCAKNSDCNDGRDCTDDQCDKTAQKCVNTLRSGRCLIGGACYVSSDTPTDNTCRVCDPNNDPLDWTLKADTSPCADDGLSCTVDSCSSGKCAHEIRAGHCLIGGACVADGDSDPSDPCRECFAASSQTQTTFVAGKPCSVGGSNGAAFCVRNGCRALVEDASSVVAGTLVRSSALAAVAKVSGSGVWAVGEFEATGSGTSREGVIARLDGTALLPPTVAPEPLRAIHHKLVVGDGGIAYHYTGQAWVRAASLESKLSGKPRYGVWGAITSTGKNLYLISGTSNNTNTEPGVWECSESLGAFNCSAGATFSKGARIGGVFGTLAGSDFGPSWASAFGTYEDIYFRANGAWSWNAPGGCFDGSATACDNTDNHDFADLFGSSDKDVWAVGTNGLIVVYDGQGWKRISGAHPLQTSYDFDAVFSGPSDELVTLAGHRDLSSGRTISLFNYNTKYDRWFGPIIVKVITGSTRDGTIADINGEGYTNLWMVGRLPKTGGAPAQYTAWVLSLK